jgi:hypothetical protein
MTRGEAKRKLRKSLSRRNRPSHVCDSSTLSFAQKVEQWEQSYVVKRKPSNQELMRYHIRVRYTHLPPHFMQGELARVPDYPIDFGAKVAVFDPFDPKLQAVA